VFERRVGGRVVEWVGGLDGFEDEVSNSGRGGLYCDGEKRYTFTEGTDNCQKLCGKVSQDMPASGHVVRALRFPRP
jgi:hypothetical protein